MIDQDDTSVHGIQEPEGAEPTPTSVAFQSSAEEPGGLFDYEGTDLLGEAPESEHAESQENDYVDLPDVSAFAGSGAEEPVEGSGESAESWPSEDDLTQKASSEPEMGQFAFPEEVVDAESSGEEAGGEAREHAVESGEMEGAERAAESVPAEGGEFVVEPIAGFAAEEAGEQAGESTEAGEQAGESTEAESVEDADLQAMAEEAQVPEAAAAEEMPEDLRAVSELLDRPTAEIMAITADTPGNVAQGDEGGVEPGEAAQGAGAQGEQATAEGDVAAEGEQATAAFDDIEPGTAAGVEASAELDVEGVSAGPAMSVSWWPFIGYMVAWLAIAGYAVWQMQQLPAGQAAYESDLYSISVLAGLVLLGIGPVLLLIVWLASWIGRANVRIGSMFISALIKGATATLFGAIVWIGALMLIDYLRLGRPY